LRTCAWLVALTAILAGIQFGPAAGIFIAMLMSVPLLPFSQTVCLGANTLTNLIPTLVTALDVVSREQVGFIPSVNRDPSADRVAKNQTLYSWLTGAATIGNIAPANVSPQPSDQTLTTIAIAIVNFKMSDFYFTGEEENALGGQYGNIVTDKVEQAVRAIINQMESDIFTAAYVGASRAYGTASTTPFATNTGETAQLKKILDDNGAPLDTRSLVIDTTTGAALRTLTQLTKVNEAGTNMTLRDGELLNLNKFSIKESAQITAPTAGTMASATSTSAAFTVGQTVIPLATAGTGVVAAGDIITFANDTNKYVVSAVSFAGANPASGDTITLAAPGLRKAQGVATRAITVVAASGRNLAFSKNALLLATRLPARPSSGDLATDVATVTDARSGITLELSMYPQYRQVRYEVAAAWNAIVMKPEHIATLLGA
jgi:hypothetical protein